MQIIKIRFNNESDLQDFGTLINIPVSNITKTLNLSTKEKTYRNAPLKSTPRKAHPSDKLYVNMPPCNNSQVQPYALIDIHIENEEILKILEEQLKQPLTKKTKSIWHPQLVRGEDSKYYYEGSENSPKPKYPIYIVSKGRWDKCLTAKALDKMKAEYKVIIEQKQFDKYKQYIPENKLLILPQTYLDNYDTCDSLGSSKSKGPGAARNFAWDHSVKLGFARHWVMDDNLQYFTYLNNNMKPLIYTDTIFRVVEDFVDRYVNIGISGLNYYKFCKKTDSNPPLILNTRIYSCLLIDNNIPYRWRGRYNEDTDICLRALKDGLCTVQFNTFLCEKITTQRMRGGNSKEFYDEEGTLAKSKMLEELHPDVSEVIWKFNRWHHHVDYTPFKNNKFILKDNCNKDKKIYGVKLKEIK